MKLPLIVLAGLLAIATGCSKKSPEGAAANSATDTTPEAPARTKPAAADDGAYDPNVAATVPVTPTGGGGSRTAGAAAGEGAKNWDAVVAEIAQLRSTQKTPAQLDRMNALQDEIVGAINSDPRAREAYQNLSRIINKR